ncbi:hypothetical protein JCM9279_004648 [Rhodotorula babjevae]
MAQDYSRAIIHSLFAQQPGSPHPPQETFLAYCQTFEDQPGSTQRKARFLILAAQRDGRCRLHKAKQNANGSFSIGKTWSLDDLQRVEVGKRLVTGRMHPLEFTLIINSKTYRYETELPSSHQAQFLVTLVRCWRRYMTGIGRSPNDLVLVGFSVDTPAQQAAAAAAQQPPPPHQQQQQRPPASAMPPPSRPTRAPVPSAGPAPLSASARSEYGPPPPSAAASSSSRPSTSSSRQGSFNERDRPPAGAPPASRQPQPGPPPSQQQRPPSPRRAAAPPPAPAAAPTITVAAAAAAAASTSALAPTASQRRPSGVAPDARPGPPPVASSSSTLGGPGGGLRVDVSSAPGGAGARPGSAGSGSSAGRAAAVPVSPSGPMPLSAVSRKAAEEHIDDDAVLANVEEMLEGFEWRGTGGLGLGLDGVAGGGGGGGAGRGKSKADEIEKRLVGELKALEAASIHAIMESDDRVVGVVKQLDDAVAELDKMDLMIGLYKTQLNLMTDDIAHIESQNRGLQVQTSNQRALLSELDKLMSTIHIPDHDLTALAQESLESQQGIEKLERSVVSLYKALLSTRDTAVGDMAAASERVGEYRAKAQQFSKRVFDFLSIMFKFQVDQVLNPKDAAAAARDKGRLKSHAAMEDFLGRYCGLMLFVKEIDQQRYQLICSAYFTVMSDLHRQEIQGLMTSLKNQVKKATDDELEASFTIKDSPTMRQQSMRRVGTIARAPLEGGKKDKDKDGKLTGSEAFAQALQQVTPHLAREQGFISDFLHINPLDASITFADYMSLETFFRRGATSYLAQQAQKGQLRDIRSAMEVVFGFLEGEMRDWIDAVLQKDSAQIVGILAVLDRFVLRTDEGNNEFFKRVLQKQYQRSLLALERSCKEQIRNIEQTKLTLKKRKGVVPFVRVFPLFVARIEAQLDGADSLNIRQVIDGHYERIVASIFDCLQQMAKMDGEGQGTQGEGKDQLNYHVILIENMHHIITVFSTKQRVVALGPFVSAARAKYDQNLAAYIRLILRRPLARQLDWFAGLEQLLRTTPPTEVSLHTAYTRSALRRITAETRAKDLRKAIDALYKRVDKHFGAEVVNQAAQQKDVLKTVWKACEDELVRLVAEWKALIAKCYPDDKGGGLEVGRQELHTFFSNAQLSPR